jgi:GNAT superfamily N-acetyltransferase
MRLEFAGLETCSQGKLAEMLLQSYAPLLSQLPMESGLKLRRGWDEFDCEVHGAPDTVGRCGFLTVVDGEPIGFGSWDPRGWPESGRVGHNCVRPEYQRRGFGQRQVAEILERLRARGFATAEARTGEQAFFEPARRMYERCGFKAVGRTTSMLGPEYGTLIYRVSLEGGRLTSA